MAKKWSLDLNPVETDSELAVTGVNVDGDSSDFTC
jgi:hypothetical protein